MTSRKGEGGVGTLWGQGARGGEGLSEATVMAVLCGASPDDTVLPGPLRGGSVFGGTLSASTFWGVQISSVLKTEGDKILSGKHVY